MVLSALCSRQVSAFHAYLGCLGCKIHRPDHGSDYSHLLELLRIQKHKSSPVTGDSMVYSYYFAFTTQSKYSNWKFRRMASNSTSLSIDVQKAADPDAAVLHLGTGTAT